MNRTKHIFALVLSLIIVATTGIPVFAAGSSSIAAPKTIDYLRGIKPDNSLWKWSSSGERAVQDHQPDGFVEHRQNAGFLPERWVRLSTQAVGRAASRG
jgi:hypothetical protein